MIQGKAQSEENGRVLFKDCNAVLNHLVHSLWACCEASARVVEPLGNGLAITCLQVSPSGQMFRSTLIRQYYVEGTLEVTLCAC